MGSFSLSLSLEDDGCLCLVAGSLSLCVLWRNGVTWNNAGVMFRKKEEEENLCS